MVDDTARYLFDTLGFVVLRGALHPDQVDRLNARIDELHLWPRPGQSRAEVGGFIESDALFWNLIDQPVVLPYLMEWLGHQLRLDHAYLIFADQGAPAHELHLGATPYVRSCSYEVRDGRIRSELTVVSFALTDVPEGLGFACVPGSHKASFACPSAIARLEQAEHVVIPKIQRGDALIFTEALTHGATAWTAPFTRRALLYKYTPGHIAWARPSWSQALRESVSPRQRHMLDDPYTAGRMDQTTDDTD